MFISWCRHPIAGGQQSTIFNSMSRVSVGGGGGGARSFSGVAAGLVLNAARLLDRAAAGDPAAALRGDVRRAAAPLDRDINRMQQVPFVLLYSLVMRKVRRTHSRYRCA